MATILIIDDDAALRTTLKKVLRLAGHTVLVAGEGGEGLRLFRQGSVDLVVTDLVMPGKDGIETIQELREEAPRLPILAISGGTSVDRNGPLSDAESFGADASVAKPFELIDFLKVVDRLLGE